MASRSWEKAHSPYWSLHVEAWRQSGMDRAVYCRQHGLSIKTFGRWMKHLISKEEARKHAEYLLELRREERRQQRVKNGKRRQKRRYAVSTDIRSRAIQAFWAMHVEAMNWSGMAVREYAAALRRHSGQRTRSDRPCMQRSSACSPLLACGSQKHWRYRLTM